MFKINLDYNLAEFIDGVKNGEDDDYDDYWTDQKEAFKQRKEQDNRLTIHDLRMSASASAYEDIDQLSFGTVGN